MQSNRIAELQNAAREIETDGVEAVRSVAIRYGEEIAMTLLIAHLRRACGSTDSYPADANIDDKVLQMLREQGLVES